MADSRRGALAPTILTVVLLVVMAVVLVYPIGLTVRGAFASDAATGEGFTLEHIAMVFRDPVLVQGLINAGLVAVATTALSILIALPLAVLNARCSFPLQGFFASAILAPLILPPFVGAIGVQALLGRQGALNALLATDMDILGEARFWGVVIVEALHLYPIIYLNATAALANLDPALEEAAENIGAGPWRRFITVTLPLIRPGLFAGSTIVLIWSLTDLGTPLMFDYTVITPVQVFIGLKEVSDSAEPYALTLVLLASAVLLYVVGRMVFGRRGHAMYAKAARASDVNKLEGGDAIAATGLFGFVTLIALLPHVGVALTAFSQPGSWYASILPQAWTLANVEQALSHPDAF
ncbi:MAG: ABC transporter permease subunit, partial [Planctomycetota bacterium]